MGRDGTGRSAGEGKVDEHGDQTLKRGAEGGRVGGLIHEQRGHVFEEQLDAIHGRLRRGRKRMRREEGRRRKKERKGKDYLGLKGEGIRVQSIKLGNQSVKSHLAEIGMNGAE